MVIFTSDHGEQLGDHWLLGKIGYHDESFRIPLVIKDAGENPRAGQVEAAFTESVDVMPTILAALGGEIPRASDGHDLLPLVHSGPPAGWRRFAFTEYDFRDVFYSTPQSALGLALDDCALCCVQDEHFKYVHFSGLPPLFFDLRRDPRMFHNLADDPAHAALVRDWAQLALSHRMRHAERTLTHFRATPAGLEARHPTPPAALPLAAQ